MGPSAPVLRLGPPGSFRWTWRQSDALSRSVESGLSTGAKLLTDRLRQEQARGSEAEEFAPQRVLVEALAINDFPVHLILAEVGGFPLVELRDVVVA